MKHIGKVQNISPKGRLIIRVDKPPNMGAPIYSKDGGVIGTIHDIFGPEKRPYISVDLKDKARANNLYDKDVYI